jgi:hypothetical protein
MILHYSYSLLSKGVYGSLICFIPRSGWVRNFHMFEASIWMGSEFSQVRGLTVIEVLDDGSGLIACLKIKQHLFIAWSSSPSLSIGSMRKTCAAAVRVRPAAACPACRRNTLMSSTVLKSRTALSCRHQDVRERAMGCMRVCLSAGTEPWKSPGASLGFRV